MVLTRWRKPLSKCEPARAARETSDDKHGDPGAEGQIPGWPGPPQPQPDECSDQKSNHAEPPPVGRPNRIQEWVHAQGNDQHQWNGNEKAEQERECEYHR